MGWKCTILEWDFNGIKREKSLKVVRKNNLRAKKYQSNVSRSYLVTAQNQHIEGNILKVGTNNKHCSLSIIILNKNKSLNFKSRPK